jgi:hypothetical protein
MMFENACDFLTYYSTEDFENLAVGLGTVLVGTGTLLLGRAGLKNIPRALSQRSKDMDLIRLYQKVVYRMYREIEASPEGMAYALPEDLDQLSNLLVKTFPQIGGREAADRLLDDLMLEDYFKTVRGNTTVVETAKWDPADRSRRVDPKSENLPQDD